MTNKDRVLVSALTLLIVVSVFLSQPGEPQWEYSLLSCEKNHGVLFAHLREESEQGWEPAEFREHEDEWLVFLKRRK